jgi:hypothetical protein
MWDDGEDCCGYMLKIVKIGSVISRRLLIGIVISSRLLLLYAKDWYSHIEKILIIKIVIFYIEKTVIVIC